MCMTSVNSFAKLKIDIYGKVGIGTNYYVAHKYNLGIILDLNLFLKQIKSKKNDT